MAAPLSRFLLFKKYTLIQPTSMDAKDRLHRNELIRKLRKAGALKGIITCNHGGNTNIMYALSDNRKFYIIVL